ncbi:unnamed protein product, partial [Meganyctiphanes norvegica]
RMFLGLFVPRQLCVLCTGRHIVLPPAAELFMYSVKMMYSPPTISRKGGSNADTFLQPPSSTPISNNKGKVSLQKQSKPASTLSTSRSSSTILPVIDKKIPKVESVPLNATERLALQEAVRCAGQRILFSAFNILFKGDVYNMKKYFKGHGFTNNMYKDTFNNSERMKLDKGVAGSWDMPLLYKVLQRVCGLAQPDDSCWTKDKAGVDGESIEYLIFSTKDICAKVIHSNDINQHQVKTHLADLKGVFTKITRRFMRRNKERQSDLEQLKKFFEETLKDFIPKTTVKSIY